MIIRFNIFNLNQTGALVFYFEKFIYNKNIFFNYPCKKYILKKIEMEKIFSEVKFVFA